MRWDGLDDVKLEETPEQFENRKAMKRKYPFSGTTLEEMGY